jgi:hypothetical protein
MVAPNRRDAFCLERATRMQELIMTYKYRRDGGVCNFSRSISNVRTLQYFSRPRGNMIIDHRLEDIVDLIFLHQVSGYDRCIGILSAVKW